MTWRRLALNGFYLLLALLVLAGCVTAYLATQQIKRAEAAYPPIGDFIEVDGRQVHYLQQGSGPHVVLLHGAGGNLREFTIGLMENLAQDYTVTAFDRPGLGYTDLTPQAPSGPFATQGDAPLDQAQMLRTAAEQLGIKDPVVVGHSFGGIVAMAWATLDLDSPSLARASAVVSFAGVLMPWPGDLGTYYTTLGRPLGGAVLIPAAAAYASEDRINAGIPDIFAPNPVPEDYIASIGAPLTVRTPNFRANVRQVNTLRPHVVDLSKRYPELTLPIEIIHGTEDTTVPLVVHPQELIKIVETANLTPLQGVGHMPHHADAEAAVAAINRAADRAGLR